MLRLLEQALDWQKKTNLFFPRGSYSSRKDLTSLKDSSFFLSKLINDQRRAELRICQNQITRQENLQ